MDYDFDEPETKNVTTIIIVIMIVAFIIILIVFFSCTKINKKIEDEEPKILKKSKEPSKQEEINDNKQYIYVDLKGAVLNPNVYKIETGTRIIDLINLAGGLAENADTSILNLSKELKDEMCIIIYTKEDILQYKNQMLNTEQIKQKLDETMLSIDKSNDAEIVNNKTNEYENNIKVSINNATKEEFLNINGIGESKADAIIKYREENGLFESIEQIKNVNGIGDSLYEKIKDYIQL